MSEKIIGIPRDMSSVFGGFKNAPANAMQVYEMGWSKLAAEQGHGPLAGFRKQTTQPTATPRKGPEQTRNTYSGEPIVAVATPSRAPATEYRGVAQYGTAMEQWLSARPRQRVSTRVIANLKSFRGPNAGAEAYAAAATLKAIMGQDMGLRDPIAEDHCHRMGVDIKATAKEATGESGGYTVESPLHSAVIQLMARVGVARRLATVFPMKSDTLAIGKVDNDSFGTVMYPTENSTINPSQIEFAQVELQARKRAIITFCSEELDSDMVIAFADACISQFGYGLTARQDMEFWLGDGTSTYGGEVGIIGAVGAAGIHQAASGHDTWPELDIDDFVATQGLLPDWAADGREAWVCSAAFYSIAMLGSVGGNNQGVDADGNPMFLGRPVFFCKGAPTTATAASICCAYGNFAASSVIGDRIPFNLKSSRHADFANGSIAYRGMSRWDIGIHSGGDATTPGGIVCLKTAA